MFNIIPLCYFPLPCPEFTVAGSETTLQKLGNTREEIFKYNTTYKSEMNDNRREMTRVVDFT